MLVGYIKILVLVMFLGKKKLTFQKKRKEILVMQKMIPGQFSNSEKEAQNYCWLRGSMSGGMWSMQSTIAFTFDTV